MAALKIIASSISFSGCSCLTLRDDYWLGIAELILCEICNGFLVDIVEAISDPPLLLARAFFKNCDAAELELL